MFDRLLSNTNWPVRLYIFTVLMVDVVTLMVNWFVVGLGKRFACAASFSDRPVNGKQSVAKGEKYTVRPFCLKQSNVFLFPA